ncbi:1,6-anhydro-N-acetylmuramyl-L-alanine amidase AmpD [Nitrosomonas sp. HPC101]|uniref:1,6-anhydro-N-acetylmuramyl-L-alanine amidase AmpD n=1 Tax=Nitrosomonas sp. HPC101 TaxID=1658667 RepID=UPI0013686800|nr:1,6-anhydro-N-acetylmuramyl-L-alanine amidase AmpD [Nitrosomonas sp. HPC101]MXS85748.1 1,6-anhydro-N-acetylmuramyl-L-alanine amidase AmpD [Nitrosomonas sp. HPC101]
MLIDTAGHLTLARYIPSPNCDERPDRSDIRLLVIHAISLPPEEFGGDSVIELFTNQLDPQAHPYYQGLQDLKVSSHFFIRRDGEIIQFVPCTLRAWHAGISSWQGRSHCNDFSIGVELEGSDNQPFEPVQYTRLVKLTRAIQAAYPVDNIVGHADIAPHRKTDPGPYFDWQSYYQALEPGNLG